MNMTQRSTPLGTVPFGLLVLAAAFLGPAPTQAANGYDQPPQSILDVMHAPSPPTPNVSPTGDRMLLIAWQDYPPMSRVAAPFLRLAGARLEIANHSKHDTPGGYGITPCATRFELVSVPAGKRTPVALPAGACANNPVWAADGKRYAFANVTATAVELWIGDASTGAARAVPGARMNPIVLGWSYWLLLAGIVIMVSDLTVAGLVEGELWKSAAPWLDSVRAAQPYWLVRTFSFGPIAAGFIALLFGLTTGKQENA